jgi:hypothetical protein
MNARGEHPRLTVPSESLPDRAVLKDSPIRARLLSRRCA